MTPTNISEEMLTVPGKRAWPVFSIGSPAGLNGMIG
jgi:hypothetical protein